MYSKNTTPPILYNIPAVKANPLLFVKYATALNIAARTTNIICGVTSAVAIAAPTCSAPSVEAVAPAK